MGYANPHAVTSVGSLDYTGIGGTAWRAAAGITFLLEQPPSRTLATENAGRTRPEPELYGL
jgi:hypothetical protein